MNTTETLKRGQRVYIKGHAFDWSQTLTPATIVKQQHNVTSIPNDEWYIIKYADSGKMTCHRSNMTLGNQ